ncbi:dienelactone hydrolase family protein [Bradyrhizobium sp. CB1717]|uniref:dienelactone hydrolase family protein n=1 Tax=Bradyrhizobium sp. CB1717 TaxID=3039154 RepID=UPI0024B1EE61|nr:dienelactone hydrolase family protein [Bradyrhizobium sp. CB1717]WFU23218.1 dienelactone hydrolase family protein [Bradyrhizobium sp. CB1717]
MSTDILFVRMENWVAMKVTSTIAKIKIDNSYMGGYLALPRGAPRGGVVVLQEIFGVTPAMRAIADDFATEGYAALVPDIYWRMQRDLDLGNGEDPAQRQAAVDFSERFDERVGTTDICASLDWLANYLKQSSRPGLVGFCLGGRLAVRAASLTEVACMVSMYGVRLDSLGEEIRKARSPMQFHFGENDNHNPMVTINRIREIVTERAAPNDEFYTYPDAEHAFYNRFRTDRFNEKAHRLARSRVVSFLRQYIG